MLPPSKPAQKHANAKRRQCQKICFWWQVSRGLHTADGNVIRIRVFERQSRQCGLERGGKKKTGRPYEEAKQKHIKECNFTSVPDASNKMWQARLILLVDWDASRAGCDWDPLGNEKSFESMRHVKFAYAVNAVLKRVLEDDRLYSFHCFSHYSGWFLTKIKEKRKNYFWPTVTFYNCGLCDCAVRKEWLQQKKSALLRNQWSMLLSGKVPC